MSKFPSKAAIALASALAAGSAFAADTTDNTAAEAPSAQQTCNDLAKDTKNLTIFDNSRSKIAMAQKDTTGCQYSFGLDDKPLLIKTFNLATPKEANAFTSTVSRMKRLEERSESRTRQREQRNPGTQP
ncbi:MAG: hypothetical protein ACK4NR_08375 [Micavibrio sp.]